MIKIDFLKAGNSSHPIKYLTAASLSAALVLAGSILAGCNQVKPESPGSQKTVTEESTATDSPVSTADWYELGQQQASQRIHQQANHQRAKNIILVVGDGMGITSLTSGRIYAGQQQGLDGEEYQLAFEDYPYSALVKTYNTDKQTPDSAGTMTALITGTKTRAGVLSVTSNVVRSDCSSSSQVNPERALTTLMDLARQQGKATGVVTTTRITHATPAATYAHSVERNWESDNNLSDEARKNGCVDIAQQLINEAASKDGLDIILGGGARHFLPKSEGGKRTDGRNLIGEWQAIPDHHFINNLEGLQSANLSTGSWLGLFSSSHLPYVEERSDTTPGLTDMVQAAVERLEADENGYVLVIESGRIDHAHHEGKGLKALKEVEELHQSVSWLNQNLDFNDTLVLVTADHSHTLTLAGYPTRGNPIEGLVIGNDEHGHATESPVVMSDGATYTSMNYRNGPGAVVGARPSPTQAEARSADYRQQSLVPLESETHGGEDVAVYGKGPWADLLGGTMEQHWLFHVMKHAMMAEPIHSTQK